jgi:hypothetical protein
MRQSDAVARRTLIHGWLKPKKSFAAPRIGHFFTLRTPTTPLKRPPHKNSPYPKICHLDRSRMASSFCAVERSPYWLSSTPAQSRHPPLQHQSQTPRNSAYPANSAFAVPQPRPCPLTPPPKPPPQPHPTPTPPHSSPHLSATKSPPARYKVAPPSTHPASPGYRSASPSRPG